MKTLRKAVFLLALSPMFTLACGGTGGGADNDSDTAVDSTDTADQTSALSSALTDSVDTGVTTADGAATVSAANSGTFFMPAGCLVASATTNVVTYTFNDCTGPYGLVHVKGTVIGTYTVNAANNFSVALASSNLTLNDSKITLNATATVVGVRGNRSATVNSSTRAVTRRNNTIEHSGSYTARWDGMCVDLDGAFSTRVGLIQWATNIANYRRCVGRCPTRGAVTITAGARSLSVNFSGGASATVTGSDGRIVNVNLFCTP